MENALYGGRVDNTYDMRVLYSYLHQYFDDSVITGKTGYTQLSKKSGTGLPIGNIPVSYKMKVHALFKKNTPFIHVIDNVHNNNVYIMLKTQFFVRRLQTSVHVFSVSKPFE